MNNSDPVWYKGFAPWQKGLPYLTPDAVTQLEHRLRPDFTVLEFGAGGSTLFFARHCKEVFSFETSQIWRDKVRLRLDQENLNNVNLQHLAEIPKFSNGTFDVILVDSFGQKTDREQISRDVLPFLKNDGLFILDNYGRYKLSFLPEAEWNIERYDDLHWDGRGTLIATRKTKT